jgi:excisionase family DNA binding protein
MAKSSGEEYLPVGEVAEELDISAKSVRKLIHQGELTGYRFTARIVVRRTDLEEFKSRRRIVPPKPTEEAS